MKKYIKGFLILGLCIGLVGCGEKKNDDVYDLETITAPEIVELFKTNGLPVGETLIFDENTDVNGLLGRPNEYIEKLDFEVTTLIEQQSYSDTPFGGTIEIFENEKDAKARYDYIDAIAHSGPLSMYMYLHKNTLVRIEKDVLPEEAAKYDAILVKLENGEIEKSK